jgi:hypothetical protein
LSARKLRIAPHRARLPGKKEVKVTTHIVRVPLWLLRHETWLYFHPREFYTWQREKKREKKVQQKWWQINGGGGLAGYICPWLPHLYILYTEPVYTIPRNIIFSF